MTRLSTELSEAHKTVTILLDELQLEAYLFEIEPTNTQWQLTVECAINEGWQTVKLKANKDYFQHGADDALLHRFLLDEWQDALSVCKIKTAK